MKKLAALFVICLWVISSHAQKIKINTGKKIQAILYITMNTKMNQNDSVVMVPMKGQLNIDFELKSVTGKQITLISTLKRINVSATLNGVEQKFDSDEPPTANNPIYADAEPMKDLNKPKSIIINRENTELTYDFFEVPSGEEIAKRLFIPINIASAKNGFTWSDSTISTKGSKLNSTYTETSANGTKTSYHPESKLINTYTVTKVSKDEIIIKGISISSLNATKQQLDNGYKMKIQGDVEGIRIYDANTGFLKSESDMITIGNGEMKGESIPISVKGKAFITVK